MNGARTLLKCGWHTPTVVFTGIYAGVPSSVCHDCFADAVKQRRYESAIGVWRDLRDAAR